MYTSLEKLKNNFSKLKCFKFLKDAQTYLQYNYSRIFFTTIRRFRASLTDVPLGPPFWENSSVVLFDPELCSPPRSLSLQVPKKI
jgi:hypothetical protein